MKEYPSISCKFREIPNAFVFAKLDGSNLRFEWVRKKGWSKAGTRHHLFDATDLQFGEAIGLFKTTIADELEKLAVDQRWERLIVFAEFWGIQSFAGTHVPGDPKTLTVFDLNPYKQGILGPREFLKLLGDNPNVPTPAFLGQFNWTRGFVDRVFRGELSGSSLEGVVGKSGIRHDLVMAKAKTHAWIDQVHARFSPEEAEKIVNS